MTASNLERRYRCLLCGKHWKGFTTEITVNGRLEQPRCPDCAFWMVNE